MYLFVAKDQSSFKNVYHLKLCLVFASCKMKKKIKITYFDTNEMLSCRKNTKLLGKFMTYILKNFHQCSDAIFFQNLVQMHFVLSLKSGSL